jgi:hypothetical protein
MMLQSFCSLSCHQCVKTLLCSITGCGIVERIGIVTIVIVKVLLRFNILCIAKSQAYNPAYNHQFPFAVSIHSTYTYQGGITLIYSLVIDILQNILLLLLYRKCPTCNTVPYHGHKDGMAGVRFQQFSDSFFCSTLKLRVFSILPKHII